MVVERRYLRGVVVASTPTTQLSISSLHTLPSYHLVYTHISCSKWHPRPPERAVPLASDMKVPQLARPRTLAVVSNTFKYLVCNPTTNPFTLPYNSRDLHLRPQGQQDPSESRPHPYRHLRSLRQQPAACRRVRQQWLPGCDARPLPRRCHQAW